MNNESSFDIIKVNGPKLSYSGVNPSSVVVVVVVVVEGVQAVCWNCNVDTLCQHHYNQTTLLFIGLYYLYFHVRTVKYDIVHMRDQKNK